MTDAIRLWDRVMFWALLVLVIFVPYSAAATEGCLLTIILAWLIKHFLIWKSHPNYSLSSIFNFSSFSLVLPLIIIGLLIIGTIPWSHAPALSLKKFFSRFLQQVFLMYVVTEIIQSPKRLYQVLIFLMWTILVVMVDVFVQYVVGHSFIFHKHTLIYQRVSGSMRHPNDLGTLLVTVLPITIALILTRNFWIPILFKKRFFIPLSLGCAILIISMLISLGLTSSRGAWVAFTLIMIGGCVFLKKYSWTAIVIVSLTLFFLVFGVYFTNTRTDIFVKGSIENEQVVLAKASSESEYSHAETIHPNASSISEHGHAETMPPKVSSESEYSHEKKMHSQSSMGDAGRRFFTPSRRIEYWQTAAEVIKRYLIFGCGYNAYIQTLQKLKLTPVEYPHNSILHITAELGIVGVVVYLWFFLALFTKGLKILKSISFHYNLYLLGCGIYFGIIAWFIHSLLDTPWESLQLSLLWWLLIGVLMSLSNVGEQLKLLKGEK